MNFPEELKYTRSHEWVKEEEDGTVLIGLTDYAQNELGDLVFVNLPEEGDELMAGETFGDVESVKAVSDVFSPVTGVIAEVNEELWTRRRASTPTPTDHGSSVRRISRRQRS